MRRGFSGFSFILLVLFFVIVSPMVLADGCATDAAFCTDSNTLVSCTETDGGFDVGNYGELSIKSIAGELKTRDQCFDAQFPVEEGWSGAFLIQKAIANGGQNLISYGQQGKYLLETTCANSIMENKISYLASRIYKCLNGCSNGVCLKEGTLYILSPTYGTYFDTDILKLRIGINSSKLGTISYWLTNLSTGVIYSIGSASDTDPKVFNYVYPVDFNLSSLIANGTQIKPGTYSIGAKWRSNDGTESLESRTVTKIIISTRTAPLVCETDYFTPLENDVKCIVNYDGVVSTCIIPASKENGHQCKPDPQIRISAPIDGQPYSPVEGVSGSFSGVTCNSIESSYNGSQFFFNCNNKVSPIITEMVKCIFNSAGTQTCYSGEYSCNSKPIPESPSLSACTINVKGGLGKELTWKSNCGGYAYTVIDGVDEYAKFDCTKYSEDCVCTLEYNPVCAIVKECSTSCPESTKSDFKECVTECRETRKTFGNSCQAKCENAQYAYAGECREDNLCGGIAGIKCPTGYECRIEGNYPDAGGKCVLSCPEYMPPLCKEGQKIVATRDSRGCLGAKCVDVNNVIPPQPQSEFYQGAYWRCSNGQEYKQYSDKCTPIAEWKELARKTCAKIPDECTQKCGVNSFYTGATCKQDNGLEAFREVKFTCYDGTTTVLGGDTSCKPYSTWVDYAKEYCSNRCSIPISVVNSQPTTNPSGMNTTTTQPVSTTGSTTINPSATAQGIQGIITNYISGLFAEVTATSATQSASTTTNQRTNSTTSTTSSTSSSVQTNAVQIDCSKEGYVVDFEPISPCKPNESCYAQSIEEIKQIKQGCEVMGGEVIVTTNEKNCYFYTCAQRTEVEKVCKTREDISQEKYDSCTKLGGQLLVKTNEQGCIVLLDCVGSTPNKDNSGVNKNILSDKATLLGLALKIEGVKIELEGISDKLESVINYYSNKGDANSKAKFISAKELLVEATTKLNTLKAQIKNKVQENNFTEEDAKQVSETIRSIVDNTITRVLLKLLD